MEAKPSSARRCAARRARQRRQVQNSEHLETEWNGITKVAILKPNAQGWQKAEVNVQKR